MRGRILRVKKTTLLIISVALCLSAIIGLGVTSWCNGYKNEWFFIFCAFVGVHFLFRAYLMRVDSNFYLGIVMFLVGVSYFYCEMAGVLKIYPSFILLAFAFASFFTYFAYKQPFQFIIFLSLIFATFGLAFYLLNLLSLYIFLAFLLLSVLLLVCRYLIL